MNDTKTEFITFGTSILHNKEDLDSITAGEITVNCSKSKKAKLALYWIHLIKNVRKYLTITTTKMLMCALILSQLDCINSILTNTSLTTTKLYQKVHNQAA